MRRVLTVFILLLALAVYIGRPTKGDSTAKQQTYIGVFYCLKADSAVKQKQSGQAKVVVGYSIPSLDPNSPETKSCVKDGGVPMAGYVEVTPPFGNLNEGASPKN